MKKTFLALIMLAALAACKERKADPRPNYEGTRSASEKAHESLDKEAAGR